jgi:hypothetical protein
MNDAAAVETVEGQGNTRLSLLLAMAMFVLVVDTSLMNVSISAVVKDLNTTVSGVQSAIALEALVSAAQLTSPFKWRCLYRSSPVFSDCSARFA